MSKADKLARAAARLARKDDAPPRTELEARARELRVIAANEIEPLVSPEAFANGDYKQVGRLGDARKALVNCGGTPIARWKQDKLLSDTQALAIDYCIRLWERAGRQKLTANPMQAVGLPPSSGWSQQEALDELKRFKGKVPDRYWSVFENVCRFDIPTGVAGSELSNDRKTVNAQTRIIVCFVADLICMWKRF